MTQKWYSIQDSDTASSSQRTNICACARTHKSRCQLSRTVDVMASSPKTPLPSQTAHTSLSAPRGPLLLCTSLAPPTVYFQQLGFGLCHPCTRQPGLPSLRPLSASWARCPPWQGTTKEHRAGRSTEAGGYRLLEDYTSHRPREKTLWTWSAFMCFWTFDVLLKFCPALTTKPYYNLNLFQEPSDKTQTLVNVE